MESAAVGFFNILKMLLANATPMYPTTQGIPGISFASGFIKIFMIIFFSIHYSGFMFAHLMFIFFLGMFFQNNVPITIPDIIAIFYAAIVLFVSHGISFLTNYVGKKEYLNVSTVQQMFAPYGRIFVMHITIIIGAFFVIFTGLPAAIIIIFILAKTVADIGAHLKQHLNVSISKPVDA
jgi:hypothetical protein